MVFHKFLAFYQFGLLWMYERKCQYESETLVGYGVALTILNLLLTLVVFKHVHMELEMEMAVRQIEEIYRQRSCDLQYYDAVEEQKKQLYEMQRHFFEQLERMRRTMQSDFSREMVPELISDTTHSLECTVIRRYCECSSVCQIE